MFSSPFQLLASADIFEIFTLDLILILVHCKLLATNFRKMPEVNKLITKQNLSKPELPLLNKLFCPLALQNLGKTFQQQTLFFYSRCDITYPVFFGQRLVSAVAGAIKQQGYLVARAKMINYVNISCWVGIHGHSVVVVVCSFGFLVIIRCYLFFFVKTSGCHILAFFESHKGTSQKSELLFLFCCLLVGNYATDQEKSKDRNRRHTHKKNR